VYGKIAEGRDRKNLSEGECLNAREKEREREREKERERESKKK